jgi:hypothetical protein
LLGLYGLALVLPPRVISKLEVVVIIEVKGALIAGDVHVGVGFPPLIVVTPSCTSVVVLVCAKEVSVCL